MAESNACWTNAAQAQWLDSGCVSDVDRQHDFFWKNMPACKGSAKILRLRQSLTDDYESDDCEFDVAEHFDIPDFYDEDAHAGGDDIAKAIERMRGFNAQPFRDVLVDDPAENARQFWYGLKKLLVFAEEAIDVDERKWDAFVDRVEFVAQQAVVGFARQMDAGQVGRFGLDLEELLERNA